MPSQHNEELITFDIVSCLKFIVWITILSFLSLLFWSLDGIATLVIVGDGVSTPLNTFIQALLFLTVITSPIVFFQFATYRYKKLSFQSLLLRMIIMVAPFVLYVLNSLVEYLRYPNNIIYTYNPVPQILFFLFIYLFIGFAADKIRTKIEKTEIYFA